MRRRDVRYLHLADMLSGVKRAFGSAAAMFANDPMQLRMGNLLRRRSGTRCERQRDAVHAVTQSSGRRAIVKNVSKMTATAATMHFRAGHKKGAIVFGFNRTCEWPIKARPARAAVELCCRGEQRQVASGARKRSIASFMIKCAGARQFRCAPAQDVELGRRQNTSPFGFRFLD